MTRSTGLNLGSNRFLLVVCGDDNRDSWKPAPLLAPWVMCLDRQRAADFNRLGRPAVFSAISLSVNSIGSRKPSRRLRRDRTPEPAGSEISAAVRCTSPFLFNPSPIETLAPAISSTKPDRSIHGDRLSARDIEGASIDGRVRAS